jgi:hypothetical protein
MKDCWIGISLQIGVSWRLNDAGGKIRSRRRAMVKSEMTQNRSLFSLWKDLRKDQSRTATFLTVAFIGLLSTNLINWLLPSPDE